MASGSVCGLGFFPVLVEVRRTKQMQVKVPTDTANQHSGPHSMMLRAQSIHIPKEGTK